MNHSERYIRQVQLPGFGQEAQQKLLQSSVLVIGAGGLGVPVLQYLTGMGIGKIGIVDGDTISLSNLHRQVLYAQDEIGLPKAEVAARKLSALNPSIKIKHYSSFLSVDNALQLIEDYDLVIDATDNFSARYLVNDACVILSKPFIYGAIHQYEGHISVFNFNDGPTYRCLYPTVPSVAQIPDCNTAGVLGVVPGLIGLHQALETVKLLTGIAKTLSGFLQVFDFLNGDEYKIKLIANPENKSITTLKANYDLPVCDTANNVSATELHEWYLSGKDFFLLDVREPHEFQKAHLKNAHLIPLNKLDKQYTNIPDSIPLITLCHTGSRSGKAVMILKEKNKDLTVYNLKGGMQQWKAELGNKFVIS
jgi:adenylyltransferase/sulfurtransferase